MDELLAFAEKLGSVGFPTLLVAILYGGYKRIWVWGYQLQQCEAACSVQVQKAEAESQYWKHMAFQVTGLAETSIGIQKSTQK